MMSEMNLNAFKKLAIYLELSDSKELKIESDTAIALFTKDDIDKILDILGLKND